MSWDGESRKCSAPKRKVKKKDKQDQPCLGNVDDGQGLQFVDEEGENQRYCWPCWVNMHRKQDEEWEKKQARIEEKKTRAQQPSPPPPQEPKRAKEPAVVQTSLF